MRITWDEPKRLANLDKHGLDFADLSAEFFADAWSGAVRSGRFRRSGGSQEGTVAVIFQPLGSEAISVISMRRGKPEGKEFLAMTKFKPGRGIHQAGLDDEDFRKPAKPTDEELAQAVPFAEAFPELAESIRRGRGRPPVASPKQAVTLRLDPETIAKFKAQGPDWRARMSDVLRRA